MADILVRDVPETVIAELDAQAAVLGISRVEYVRRQLVGEAQRIKRTVTVADLKKSAGLFSDLLDEDLMERAWR